MKKGFIHFLSFLLSASVLFASTGIVIASHVCHESQQSDVTFFERQGCCSDMLENCGAFPAPSNQIKGNCCELTITYHKLEVFSPGKISLLPVIVSFPVGQSFLQNSYLNRAAVLVSNPEDTPGVLKLKPGTKNFLHSIHTLLI
ncbi:hypothetical protein BH11BAC1_BH11BAC1_29170 [soil metagenome]